jgi:hypothetical protein
VWKNDDLAIFFSQGGSRVGRMGEWFGIPGRSDSAIARIEQRIRCPMCLAVYFAADKPIPFPPWEEKWLVMNVEDVGESAPAIRRLFSKPYTYRAIPLTGCGCNFQYTEQRVDAAQWRTHWALIEYLEWALEHVPEIELLACSDADRCPEPEYRGRINPYKLFKGYPECDGQAFLVVVD